MAHVIEPGISGGNLPVSAAASHSGQGPVAASRVSVQAILAKAVAAALMCSCGAGQRPAVAPWGGPDSIAGLYASCSKVECACIYLWPDGRYRAWPVGHTSSGGEPGTWGRDGEACLRLTPSTQPKDRLEPHTFCNEGGRMYIRDHHGSTDFDRVDHTHHCTNVDESYLMPPAAEGVAQ